MKKAKKKKQSTPSPIWSRFFLFGGLISGMGFILFSLAIDYRWYTEFHERKKEEQTYQKLIQQAYWREKNEETKERFSYADEHYLSNTVETLPLLEEEQAYWQQKRSNSPFSQDQSIQKEWDNQIHFSSLEFHELSSQEEFGLRETFFALTHPVKLNHKDLERLLVYIEGTQTDEIASPKDRPLLLITHFLLEKEKSTLPKKEIFILQQMHVLQRMYV